MFDLKITVSKIVFSTLNQLWSPLLSTYNLQSLMLFISKFQYCLSSWTFHFQIFSVTVMRHFQNIYTSIHTDILTSDIFLMVHIYYPYLRP